MSSPPLRGQSPPSNKIGTSGGNKTPPRSPKGKTPQRTPSPSRSPPHRSRTRDARRPRTRGSRRPREVIVERVIRETGGSRDWPQLTKTNYNEWSLLMKVKLQARHLWDVVEHGDGDFHDDRTALEAICSAVPLELVSSLATKETAHDAWKAIKTLRIGGDRVRKATVQNLRTEYEAISLRDDEAIEDFALRLTGIVQRLATLGDPEPDAKVVAKYLRVVRPRYKQLVISIETLLDISALSIEEITGRLKAVDDVDPTPPQAASGKLLLTEEQWLERYKKQDSGCGGSNSSTRGKRRGKLRSRDGGSNSDGAGSSSGRAGSGDTCKRCGKKGHWAKDCRGKLKVEE